MGYRVNIGIAPKNIENKYKLLTYEDAKKISEDEYVIELPDIIFLHQSGVSFQNHENKKSLFSFNLEEYSGQSLFLLTKDDLKELIEISRNEVVQYFNRHIEFLEHDITKHAIHAFTIKKEEWESKIRTTYQLYEEKNDKDIEFSVISDFPDYDHFKLVELYNNTNWDKYCLIYEAH